MNRRFNRRARGTDAAGTRIGGAALAALLVELVVALVVTLPAAAQPSGLPLAALPLDDLSAFRPVAANWQIAGGLRSDRNTDQDLHATPGAGLLVNLPTDAARDNLFTTWEHGDLELELDFLMPKGSNSGVYLQGRYEVQLLDSWGVAHPLFSDAGGLYQRWDPARPQGSEGYQGQPPRVNVSRAPGLWQHLKIVFQAPRFDAQGRKRANARFLRVEHNGVVVHQNVEVTGPTRAAAFDDERPLGPLMIQGDHGPVAFRNVRFKRYGQARVTLQDVRYRFFAGAFEALPDLSRIPPDAQGALDGLHGNVGGNPDTFAVAFDGLVQVPTSGVYRFELLLDWITGDPHFQDKHVGGGMLRIGEAAVVQHDGRQRAASGQAALEAGAHPFTLAYFKNRFWHAPTAALYAEGPDTPLHALSAPGALPEPSAAGAILVEPAREPVVLRGFVAHQGTRRTHAASVGEPGGIHYSLDLAQGALLQVWKGGFVEATPMWQGRGQDQLAVPRGSILVLSGRPTLALLNADDAPWPDAVDPAQYRFLGYDLDPGGRPTFRYRLGRLDVEDRLAPGDDDRMLTRTLTLHNAPGTSLWARVAEGRRVVRLQDGAYAVDDRTYYVVFDETGGATPVVQAVGQREELRLPVRSRNGTATIRYAIIW